ncbi:unnamed protein product, partial [Prorocentrum cordatum]
WRRRGGVRGGREVLQQRERLRLHLVRRRPAAVRPGRVRAPAPGRRRPAARRRCQVHGVAEREARAAGAGRGAAGLWRRRPGLGPGRLRGRGRLRPRAELRRRRSGRLCRGGSLVM